jgi:hypothetical protein
MPFKFGLASQENAGVTGSPCPSSQPRPARAARPARPVSPSSRIRPETAATQRQQLAPAGNPQARATSQGSATAAASRLKWCVMPVRRLARGARAEGAA